MLSNTLPKILLPTLFLALFSGYVSGATWSQANIHFGNTVPEDQSDGGNGALSAAVSDGATYYPSDGVEQIYSASATASARTGRSSVNLSSSITLADDSHAASAGTAALSSLNNRVKDTFTTGAGGDLSVGDAAQVLMQVKLDGLFHLEGRPSGGSSVAFSVRAGAGLVNLPELIDYDTTGLYPPQDFEVHEFWEFLVDVTVGDPLSYQMDLSAWMNGSGFDRGTSGMELIDFEPMLRISHATGFEDLIIISEAGAPISPVPLPAAAWLFLSALTGLGVIKHNRRS